MSGRERFIPFRRDDVVRMCAARPGLSGEDSKRFGRLARMLCAHFHFRFQSDLDALKDAYAPFDPDRDTRRVSELAADESEARKRRLVEGLEAILAKGNYVRIGEEDIRRALAEASVFRIRLEIDFDDYREFVFYRRGLRTRKQTITTLFGLRKREVEVHAWERVVMLVEFREAEWFEEKGRTDSPFEPESMILKRFSNIPRDDLEMLFPLSRIRMRTIDKLVIGVPAVVSGIIVAATKLAAVVGLVAALVLFWLGIHHDRPTIDGAKLVGLAAGIAAVVSFVFRQYLKYKNRRMEFMKTLTENLYFRNLDNNAGVLTALVDEAEAEEVKEAIVAYRFLLEEEAGLPVDELDRRVEAWFREEHGADLDFDATDALDKLVELELAKREGDRFAVLPLRPALARLDGIWDAFFEPDGSGR